MKRLKNIRITSLALPWVGPPAWRDFLVALLGFVRLALPPCSKAHQLESNAKTPSIVPLKCSISSPLPKAHHIPCIWLNKVFTKLKQGDAVMLEHSPNFQSFILSWQVVIFQSHLNQSYSIDVLPKLFMSFSNVSF